MTVSEADVDRRISLVMVEDNLEMSQTIQSFLSRSPEIAMLGAARGEADFRDLIETHLPDLALIDIGLDHPRSGLDLLVWINRNYPVVKPIIMTVNTGDVLEAYQRGAKGYVLKSNLEFLAPTLKDVSEGKVILPPGVGDLFLRQMADQTARWNRTVELLQLSEREREILMLLKSGLPREVIAHRLGISFFTVRRHIQNILEKTGQASVKDALAKFGEVLASDASSPR